MRLGVIPCWRARWSRLPRSEAEQSLQSLDQDVGLAVALDHRLNLRIALLDLMILSCDLIAQENVLPFEQGHVFEVRARSRLVANGRVLPNWFALGLPFALLCLVARNGRVRSRMFVAGRSRFVGVRGQHWSHPHIRVRSRLA